MASLAGLLQAMGYRITGSDQNVYPPMSTQLEDLGIKIQQGYRKENLSPRPDLAVIGNVMSPNAEESVALMASDIPKMSMPQALAEFVIENRKSLVVTGTHGKTTTTAMLAWIAEACGVNPGFLVGGVPKNFDRSFKVPSGDYFVIEGDEYETSFLDKGSKFMHYRPYAAIMHKVEMDHIEYFKTFERLQEAFRGFLRLLPKDGVLLMFAEDPTNRELLKSASCDRALTFGWNEGDYQARIVSKNGATLEFDVLLQGKKLDRLRIEMFGDYNGLNALSAYALATQLGWDPRTVASALASFKGVKRRQEVIGKPNNILLIEDFAHHPTAVEQTVSSIAERFPNTRVFAVFEPRSATSCRKIFQQPYFEALKQAKTVVIVPPNAFREIPLEEQLSPSQLIEDLRNAGIDAHSFPKVDEVVAFLKREAKPEDVVLLMSNGAFGGIYQKLLATL